MLFDFLVHGNCYNFLTSMIGKISLVCVGGIAKIHTHKVVFTILSSMGEKMINNLPIGNLKDAWIMSLRTWMNHWIGS